MHPRAKDITGLVVGFLTAERYHGSNGKKSLWEARCVCGRVVILPATELTKQKNRGIQASCGCMRRASIGAKNVSHGKSAHPAYGVWRAMLDRCSLPTHQAWRNYGARGITVCERWRESFENFWADMGPAYQRGFSLDRRDNEQGYSPENCAWRTKKSQANNTRGNKWLDTPNGRMTLTQAAEFYKIGRSTLDYRIAKGVPVAQAVIPPRSTTS